MAKLTPYQRVMAALRGERPDRIPFTVYDNMIVSSSVERVLRNRGLCIVKRIASYNTYRPNVTVNAHSFTDERGIQLVRTIYSTPYGDLSTLHQPAGFTDWYLEYAFKTPEDYKPLRFIIEDTIVEPNYDQAVRICKELGEDFVVRDGLGLEPMQSLISTPFMSMEDYCIEWMERRDEILILYEALVKLARKIYPIVAEGPLEFANYGGNVVPEVIGVDGFRKYYMPHYEEAAAILHEKGKFIGCHLDADNSLIMEEVAETGLDYIEAYDPGISPSVGEARKMWPGKVLWINWPSAWHLDSVSEVKRKTLAMLDEIAPADGFIIGITEDVPQDRWQENYIAIMDAIDEFG
jgi:hypothetical protein